VVARRLLWFFCLFTWQPLCSAPVVSTPFPDQAFSVRTITPLHLRELQRWDWHTGCPTPPDSLREVLLLHRTFSGDTIKGLLIVHQRIARPVAKLFRTLLAQGFEINSVQPMWKFRGNDSLSMAANNSSGFSCRQRAGDASKVSLHAHGLAIDINPLQNPFVDNRKKHPSHRIAPLAGADYLDRSTPGPGKILRHDSTWWSFRRAGFRWGGTWTKVQDYQHFEWEETSP